MPKRLRRPSTVITQMVKWCVKNKVSALVISEAHVRAQIGTRPCREVELFPSSQRVAVMDRLKLLAGLSILDTEMIQRDSFVFWNPSGNRVIAIADVTVIPPIGDAPQFLLLSFSG